MADAAKDHLVGEFERGAEHGLERAVEPVFPPELYQVGAIGHSVDTLADVTDGEIAFYHEHGYLGIQNALAREEVATILAAFDALIEHNPDKTVQFERSAPIDVARRPLAERRRYVRKLHNFIDEDARLKAMSEHPALLELLARALGAEPKLYAHQAFFKPPFVGREKPWHQDHAYFRVPLGTPIVGVWIALDEATPENGCMHVIPGSHREGPVVHFKRRDWQICDTDVPLARDTVVPLAAGGLLLFDGLIHHGTPPNRSAQGRCSLQFHYVPADTPAIPDEERLAIFGSEGKGVTC